MSIAYTSGTIRLGSSYYITSTGTWTNVPANEQLAQTLKEQQETIRKYEEEIKRKEEKNKMTFTTYDRSLYSEIESLILEEAYHSLLIKQIMDNGREVPVKIQEVSDNITSTLNEKIKAKRKSDLKALKEKRNELLSMEEKRSKVEEEITKLESLVNDNK